MSKKRNISYIQQDEPTFLKKFKEKIGYKEGPDVDTKREIRPPTGDSSDEELDDERPTVVALKKGDLTQDDVDSLQLDTNILTGDTEDIDEEEEEEEEEKEIPKDGKIIFSKPKKSSSEEARSKLSSSKKDNKKKHRESAANKVKNKSLLSFNEDEEEED